MFKPNTFKVGNPIPTVEYSWIAPTTHSWKRETIPSHEILDSALTNNKKHASIEAAKKEADKIVEIALALDKSGCAFMEFECPIFEMNEQNILYVHFQGNNFTIDYLNRSEKTVSSCTIS